MTRTEGRCCAWNEQGTPCDRPAVLPDPRRGGMICEIHAWETWRSGEDILPVLEAIGNGVVPKLPALRSLMWVLVETPVLALRIMISGYAAMVEAIEEGLRASDPELAGEIMSLGGHAMAAKTMAGLLELPEDRRELLLKQSGLGQFIDNYRALVQSEEQQTST